MEPLARASGERRDSRQVGSQPALRKQNTERVLRTLARRGPTTQANLARITGLSTGTISNIVKVLDEEQRITSRPVVSGGRRAMEVTLRQDDRLVLGLHVTRADLGLVVARPDHEIVGETRVPLVADHGPADVLAVVRTQLDAVLEGTSLTPRDVVAGGLAVPAPLGAAALAEEAEALPPRWYADDLAEAAETHLPFPLHVDTAARLGALAQISWGPHQAVEHLAFVRVGGGVTAGLLMGGHLHHGARGAAGELGHFPVVELGEHCFCGNRGCLNTLASTRAVLHSLHRTRRAGRAHELADVLHLAKARDLATLRVLEDAGAALGTALGALANLLNPEVIVVGGPLAPVGAPLIDPLVRSMSRHALPSVMESTVVTTSHLGGRAELLGAATLATQHALAVA